MWLLSYLIFNACLYAGQLVLYTLLFLPNGNQEFLSKARPPITLHKLVDAVSDMVSWCWLAG